MKAANSEADASQMGTDDSGTPLGCAKDTDCPLPPIDSATGPTTLVYYTDARCVQHQCQWQAQMRQLPGGYCSTGGFLGTTTAGGAGVIPMSDGQAGLATIVDAAEDHPNIASPDAGACAEEDASSCAVPSSVCADHDGWRSSRMERATRIAASGRWATVIAARLAARRVVAYSM